MRPRDPRRQYRRRCGSSFSPSRRIRRPSTDASRRTLIAKLTGWILQYTVSYVPVFLIAASGYLVALVILHALVPRLERVKSPGRGKVLVAKYLFEGDAWFSIGAEKWKLLDGSVTLMHGERFLGLLCELSLHHDGRPIRTFRYLGKTGIS
jgi:hypothetical protein